MNELMLFLLAKGYEIRIGEFTEDESGKTYYVEAYEFDEDAFTKPGAISEWKEAGSILGSYSIDQALMELAEKLLPEREFKILSKGKN